MNEREAAAVAATFGLGSVLEPPVLAARGANGFIWKLQTDRGVYAVKRLRPWVEPEPAPFDVAVQLAAADAGIPLPRPVLTRDGAAMVDHIRVYEWARLAEELAAPVSPAVGREVGHLLGRLHRLGLTPAGASDRWYVQPPSVEDWRDVQRRGSLSGAPWSAWLAEEMGLLNDVGRRASEPASGPMITCHLDFAPSNVLPSADDGRLVVLDWENAGPLAADAELAEVLLVWSTAGDRVALETAEAVLAGYGVAPPITPASFHMTLVTHLNFLKVNLDHSLEADLRGEFVDRWIEVLHPERLRARLRAIDALLTRFW